jgi:hypothetical protein
VLLLRRLAGEASQQEVEAANRQLESSLTPEELQNLPLMLLHDPKTANVLLVQPAEINGRLASWKRGMQTALSLPQMPQADAMKELAGLTLESFLGQIL